MVKRMFRFITFALAPCILVGAAEKECNFLMAYCSSQATGAAREEWGEAGDSQTCVDCVNGHLYLSVHIKESCGMLWSSTLVCRIGDHGFSHRDVVGKKIIKCDFIYQFNLN